MARDNNGSTPFEDVDAADDFVGPLSRISTRETALASIFNEVQLFERYGQIERALEQLERVFEIVPGHPAAFEKKKSSLKTWRPRYRHRFNDPLSEGSNPEARILPCAS